MGRGRAGRQFLNRCGGRLDLSVRLGLSVRLLHRGRRGLVFFLFFFSFALFGGHVRVSSDVGAVRDIGVKIHLGQAAAQVEIVVAPDVVQILILVQTVFSAPRLARGRLMVTWGGGAGGE